MALAVGWAALFVDAWRIGQPLTLGMPHRRAVVGVNGLLCLSVAGTLLFGAHLVGVQRDLIITMFGDGEATGAHDGRYNVLLLGGDSGAGRWGLRPDSMTVASIDAETGRTVLIGLPRNMANFPFAEGSVMDEQFPDGFDCDGCYLNGVSTWAEDNTDALPDVEEPGRRRHDRWRSRASPACRSTTGRWSTSRASSDLVDAVGGVDAQRPRSRSRSAASASDVTGYIEPGTRKLDGSTRSGSPAPARAPTTTRGWRARSAS